MKKYQLLKKIIWLPLIFIVGIFVLYYYLYQDIEIKNQNILNLQNKIKIQSESEQYLKSVGNVVQNSQVSINEVNNSILDKDGDVIFIENLEKISKENGLEITINSIVIDNLSGLSKANMTTLSISATIKGSWAGNYIFLKELESIPFVLRVEKFDLVSTSNSGFDPISKKMIITNRGWQSTFEIHVLKNK